MGLLALTTDFGTSDGYVGEMKGALISRLPGASIFDVAHDIAPGDILAGSWVLVRVWDAFPTGTIHLVVIDPGVGGSRRPVAFRAGDRWFVGPDNGVASHVLARWGAAEAWTLDPERFTDGPVSTTFHGRDIFAPAAAHLASGGTGAELGLPLAVDDLRMLPANPPRRSRDLVRGRVVHVDRFGNLITNIPSAWVAPTALLEVGGVGVSGVRSSYSSVEVGELVALTGSAGTLEISVRGGSAAERLSIGCGAAVSARPERD